MRSKSFDFDQLSRRFHHSYTHAFFVQIFHQSQNVRVTRKSCRNDVSTKKFVRKNVDEIDTWMESEFL